MKKVTFTILIISILGLIAYYYAEKQNIDLTEKTYNLRQDFSRFISVSDDPSAPQNPESKDEFLSQEERVILVDKDNMTPLLGYWKWDSSFVDGELVSSEKADLFTLVFNEDSSVYGTTDCNSFNNVFTILSKKEINFGESGGTLMDCQDSDEEVFHEQLSQVKKFSVDARTLVLKFENENNSMTFIR